MSQKEVDRLEVVQGLAGKGLSQAEAAAQLGLGVRQVRRLLRAYRERGAAGLVSGHRGKRPNNAIAAAVRTEIIGLVRTQYADFGPTLACEKLAEYHGHRLSVETLRQWMVADGLWQAKPRRAPRIHQRRARRACLGELVQIDGSPHDWFEQRGPRCTLIVFIDDATSRLLALRLVPAETTQAYMQVLRQYLAEHGRPVALYSDRHSIFRVNHPDHDGELTQFSRALKSLDIEPIQAHTPQAKGRVERANKTLQDRLVKELRLRGIDDMDAANAWLAEFIAAYNQRFSVAPRNPTDAHRSVLHDATELDQILCLHHQRKLTKNLTLQFQNREIQLTSQTRGRRLRGAQLTVCEGFDGTLTLLHQGRVMPYRILDQGEPPMPVEDEKSVHQRVDQARHKQAATPNYKPPADHPWRQPVCNPDSRPTTR